MGFASASYPPRKVGRLDGATGIRMGLCCGNSGEIGGTLWCKRQDRVAGQDMVAKEVMALRTGAKWVGILLIAAVLLLASAGLGQAWRGGHGFRSHGFRGHRFHHGFHHGRAHGSASGSDSGHSGGYIGGRTGPGMHTPQWWWLPLRWLSSPHRPRPNTGITAIV
jgi:hypothetical protein